LYVGSVKLDSLYSGGVAGFGLEEIAAPDGVLEYSSADNVKNSSQSSYVDSDQFDDEMETMSSPFASRGSARWSEDMPFGNVPLGAWALTKPFCVFAGIQGAAFTLNIFNNPQPAPSKNQADVFYLSGHGYHDDNYFQLPNGATLKAADVQWKEDLDIVIFAGCSLLDVTGDKVLFPRDPFAKPGKYWAVTGPKFFLGYEWLAPLDSSGRPQDIISSWGLSWDLEYDFEDPIAPWEAANRASQAWNASAIDATFNVPFGKVAWHFRKIFGSLYAWESVPESTW
jgi:hypothetical protein